MKTNLILFLLVAPGSFEQDGVLTENHAPEELLTIPRRKNDWLAGAQDAVALSDGSIIVSDRLDYKLKKFDKKGRLIKDVGRRGKDAGEFQSPGPVTAWNDLVAVADYASSRIQLFTSELEFRSEFRAGGHIFDLRFDSEGSLWAGVLQRRRGENLLKFDLNGKMVQTISLRNATNDPFDNMFWFATDRTGDIVVAFLARNRIEIWNTRGEFKGDFSVSGLPMRAKRKKVSERLFGEEIEAPEDNIFWDVGIDSKERIFLLADEYTPNPDQDVYVVNKRGDLLSLIKLPQRAATLSVNMHDRLVVGDAGRTLIRVFQIRALRK